MRVSRCTFILVPTHPGSPGKRAVKWLCVCVYQVTVTTHLTAMVKLQKVRDLTQRLKLATLFSST